MFTRRAERTVSAEISQRILNVKKPPVLLREE